MMTHVIILSLLVSARFAITIAPCSKIGRKSKLFSSRLMMHRNCGLLMKRKRRLRIQANTGIQCRIQCQRIQNTVSGTFSLLLFLIRKQLLSKRCYLNEIVLKKVQPLSVVGLALFPKGGEIKSMAKEKGISDLIEYQVNTLGRSRDKAERTAARVTEAKKQAREEFKGASREFRRLDLMHGRK